MFQSGPIFTTTFKVTTLEATDDVKEKHSGSFILENGGESGSRAGLDVVARNQISAPIQNRILTIK